MERIGDLLSNLPTDYAKALIQILTADNWNRLDRDVNFYQLGLGIGKVVSRIDKETLKALVKSCDYYQSLCRGIAKGMDGIELDRDLILYLGNLSPVMAMELLANLELYKYPDIMKILAVNVAQIKHIPNVGSNIARQFDKLPFEIRRQILDIFKDNSMFLYEFLQSVNLNKVDNIENFLNKIKEIDEIIGYRLYEVNDKMKEKLLNFSSISVGIGKGFQNLSYHWKRKVIEKVKKDKEFAKGFLSSIDLSLLEDEFFDIIIKIGESDLELSKVLGRNFGNSLAYLTEDLKSLAFNIAQGNPDFARGFGEGISESLGSFIGFIRGKAYELKKEDQDRVLDLALSNDNFANGLLTTFNAIFFFDNKEKVIELMIKREQYLKLFIEQIGRRINDFDLFKLLSLNNKLTSELGKILCRNFIYLSKKNREIVLEWLSKNNELKEGFLQC
ncbi:hypothetical protein SULI_04390 [Saccharolobus solfataricus]|uniref:Uncharacterized protein n=3 Tax=Saccharolobus solfataricus TaxID=2287 RepID=Q97U97_SACS2|nr:hypothetical protein [Saccharolobus solfataricus]AAK43224.1 Hypothetical protein SSO3123 [Saccharolobus solfataricus P2]AKA73252.1 hypothetical protein SULB_0901 [Saccharolobus solfataricus]AKA75951.1 hypothetical protein SULC_0900 [Saccharolobus solfataricus]AKA78644.1 hypothetical protein SULA_0899 [Saccharolobus solfataricus]AZF67719.1 hypothetical protein SULG_04390 [Saccharolobus solfataricus]